MSAEHQADSQAAQQPDEDQGSRFFSKKKKVDANGMTIEEALYAQQILAQQQAEAQRQQAEAQFLSNSNFFRTVWDKVDVNTQDFAFGVQMLSHIEAHGNKKDHLTLSTHNGNQVCWMKTETEGADGRMYEGEFFGLTKSMAKKTPLNDAIADDIMMMYKARHGDERPATLVGTLEEKDILWLAAMKAGVKVANHNPGAATMEQWQALKTPAAGVTAAPGEEETPVAEDGPATTADEANALSRHARQTATSFISPERLKYMQAEKVEELLTEERLSAYTIEQLKQTVKALDERTRTDNVDNPAAPERLKEVQERAQKKLEEKEARQEPEQDASLSSVTRFAQAQQEPAPSEDGAQKTVPGKKTPRQDGP